MPQWSYVNLGLYGGAGLPDSVGILEGTGKRHRHAMTRTATDADAPALKALLAAATSSHV